MPQISPPPPVLSTADADSLRADLHNANWTIDVVNELVGEIAQAALLREIRLPALQAVRAHLTADQSVGNPPYAPVVLTALFMLGEPLSAELLDAALPITGASGMLRIGLVQEELTPEGERLLRATVDLRPHESSDDDGEVRWWVASDIGELISGEELAPDHVLGIGQAGLTLAGLTPRARLQSALDLGTGCGIQTLYLLRHCEHVTATDISARALAFTAFNVALAGVDSQRVTLLQGSFTEPLAGCSFDLIATNPPFVITPPAVREAGLPLMEYRDAGGPVLPTLVPALTRLLKPGGTLIMLGNWEQSQGVDWRETVSAWVSEEISLWAIQRERLDPVEYASMWLRDGGVTPERDRPGFEAALGAWVGDFAARDVNAVGFGYLIAHRGEYHPAWRVLEEVETQPGGPLGAYVSAVIAAHNRLDALSDEQIAQLHLCRAADVTEERHYRPGESDPSVVMLRQGAGFGRSIQATTLSSALVSVADGELSVGQIASAVAALMDLDASAVLGEMVQAVRELVHAGMLEL